MVAHLNYTDTKSVTRRISSKLSYKYISNTYSLRNRTRREALQNLLFTNTQFDPLRHATLISQNLKLRTQFKYTMPEAIELVSQGQGV